MTNLEREAFNPDYERALKPENNNLRFLGRLAMLHFGDQKNAKEFQDRVYTAAAAIKTDAKQAVVDLKNWYAARRDERQMGATPEGIKPFVKEAAAPEPEPLPHREAEASFAGNPLQPIPDSHEPGVYHSQFSGQRAIELPSDQEFLQTSAESARRKLGELPVASVLGEQQDHEDAANPEALPLREAQASFRDNPPPHLLPETTEANATELPSPSKILPPNPRPQRRGRHRAPSFHPLPHRLGLRIPGPRQSDEDHTTAPK